MGCFVKEAPECENKPCGMILPVIQLQIRSNSPPLWLFRNNLAWASNSFFGKVPRCPDSGFFQKKLPLFHVNAVMTLWQVIFCHATPRYPNHLDSRWMIKRLVHTIWLWKKLFWHF